MKTCSKCNTTKTLSEFYTHKGTKDGYRPECKTCVIRRSSTWAAEHVEHNKVRQQHHRENNLEAYKERDRLYYIKNKDKRNAYSRLQYQLHRDTRREYNRVYRNNNIEKCREACREYYRKNKAVVNKQRVAYMNRRRKTDTLFYLRTLLRISTSRLSRKSKLLIGCSWEQLNQHLGPKPCADAHLDHICPLSQAQTEEELQKLNHYSNLQWLSASENLKKSDKRTVKGVILCMALLNRDWID